jgi:hypothetical protein
MRGAGISIFCLCLAAGSGCSGPPADTPENTYRGFYQAVVDQDWDRAAAFLPEETLETFRRVGGRLAKAVGRQGDPLDFFLRGVRGHPIVPLRSVEVVSRGEQTAVLRVTAGPCGSEGDSNQCSVSEVRLRREERGWVVEPEMPELLSGGGG